MKTKRLIAMILSILMLSAVMTACKNDKPTEPSNSATPSEYTASVYRISDWRIDMEGDKREYNMTFFAYSTDYCANVTADNVLFLKDNKYQKISDCFDDITVNTYSVLDNSKAKGVCTYIKIKSPTIIDVKKMYIQIAGPVDYDVETLTQDDYLNKHGNLEGWKTVLCSVMDVTPDYDAIEKLHNIVDTNVVRVENDTHPQYYYNKINESPLTSDTEIYSEFEVDNMSNAELQVLVDAIVNNAVFVNQKDGGYETVKLPEGVTVFGRVVDNKIQIGFEVAEGSKINSVIDSIPYAITYNYSLVVEMFVINNK